MNENCKKEISSLETVTQNQTICDPKKSKNLPKMRKKNILRSETDWKNKSLDRRFFETESQTCEFCGKKYSSISNFNRHLKSCPQPTENVSEYKKTLDEQYENLKKEYLALGDRIKELEDNPKTTHETNINITINAYGKENLSFLSDNHLRKLIASFNDGIIPRLVKDIHCNPEHPENMNVYKPNKKDEYVMIFDGNQWMIDNGRKVIGRMIDDKVAFLDHRLYNMSINGCNIGNFEKLQDAAHDDEKLKKWYGAITIDLYNNKRVLIQPLPNSSS